jgi:hypothetical protein
MNTAKASSQSDAASRSVLLERCPFCEYRLDGMPVERRCPECGRPVDRRWRVFGRLPLWHCFSRGWRLGCVVVLIGLAALVGNGLRGSALHLAEWLFLAMAILCVASCIYSLLRRPRLFVAVGPGGVGVYHRHDRRWPCWEHYALDGIRRAKADMLGRIWVVLKDRKIKLGFGLATAPSEAKRSADYINAMIERTRGTE